MVVSLATSGRREQPTARTWPENEHPDLLPDRVVVRGLRLLAVEVLVDLIADELGK